MSKMKTFIKLVKDDRKKIKIAIFDNMVHIGLFNFMSDESFLSMAYRIKMDAKLNLNNPKTYSEKLQWLKIHDRKPQYTNYVDKYKVREYVKEKIGEEYIIPLLGVWENAEEIDINKLPNQFVLKCNHDSGSIILCKNKVELNLGLAQKKLRKCLKKNLYYWCREWPYKDVKPCIIAEKYMEDIDTTELRDYKFFCFDGVVKALFIAKDRYSKNEETKFDFFDADYNHLDFTNGHPNAETIPEKPENFELMKTLASKLSEGIPHVRVDFYECNGKVYFGEMTFSHWGGMVPFNPSKWDKIFGEWISMPSNKQ